MGLPRPTHPFTGLTTCTRYDATLRGSMTAADLDDYEGLKWVSNYVATEPSAAPNNVYAKQGITGWRSMFGLQPGNLNIIGPGAYMQGNDQALIPYSSGWMGQVGFGANNMANMNGAQTMPSINVARCTFGVPTSYDQ